ncbi:MAG: recombinase family protein [Defluviitaleaceae bacterium]|nr:recombinase family protein [Defluviitaleaceae bacterium]
MWQNGACYIRVSTDDQLEFSPDAQLRALKEYAKKNNIILSKQYIFIDEGISGRKAEKRPEFMRMIATAKTKPKPFDVILVHKFDRFARSREDSVVYKSLLKREADIRVVSITETIEDDKFAVILEAMLEAMAEYYSLNLAEEVKKGMTEKAIKGGYQSTPPFGYVLVDKQLVIEPTEAGFIKYLFSEFANKQMGLRQLAKHANELGFRSKRGNPFENRTVEYILHNPVYIGKVRWTPTGRTRRNYHNPDSIIADGTHEPIIDMETWEKAHDVMKTQKELYGKRQKSTASRKTWLKGLVRCGNCGNTLVWSGYQYLQCNSYAKGACKVSHAILAKNLEGLVLTQLKETFTNNLEISIVPNSQDTALNTEYDFLNERIIKIEARQNRIREAYEDGVYTLDEYKERRESLEDERKKIRSELDSMKANLIHPSGQEHIIERMETVYNFLTDTETDMDIKYKTAHFLINKIVFDKPQQLLEIEYK